MEKKRKKKRIMNNVSDIEQRSKAVNPLSLFGASALGFPDKISTVRGGMATKHTSQRVVITNPEFPRVFTGAENPYGDRSSWNVKADHDYRLRKIFRKFKDTPMSPVAYIFEDLVTGKYKCEIIRPAVNLVEKYGFRMNNKITNYMEGDIIKEGTPIAQSSSYINDNYCAGRNIRMAYAVLPELTEDSLIISDEAAEELRFDMVDIVTVNVGKNAFLLDRYGTNGSYKPFPDIGEEIKDNILCSIREDSYLSSRSEASIPHINDTNYYSHGIVTDIDIFTNLEVENEQFTRYYSQIRDWYSDIYAYISTIVSDPYQDDISLIDIYHQAEKFLNNTSWVTKQDIVDTTIRFTVLQPTKIQEGQKVVGRYGNKSVVSKIIPTRLMPHTEDGRPIHMLANALALPNRIIAFASYELTITFQMERMHQHILKLDEEGVDHDTIMEKVIDFISLYEPDQGSEIARVYRENPDQVYRDIIKNGLYLQIKPLNEVCIRDAILEAYEKYPDIMKEYELYTKLRHRWIKHDETFPVGYQYTWVLKQEPSKSSSAVATGRTTLYDLPVKTTRFKNNLRKYSDNHIKFGEYDTYNFLAGVGVKEFSKISTYFRGSQYEENSVLMSQLNNLGIDTSKYNKFPQLDNLKNMLKLIGTKLKPDVFSYSTIGAVDEIIDVKMNNITVNISIPDLRYILIMHSYYLQYREYKNGPVDMIDFLRNISQTNLFDNHSEEYIQSIYKKFTELLPVLQQMKQYE